MVVCVSVKQITSYFKSFLNFLSSNLSLVSPPTLQTRNIRLLNLNDFLMNRILSEQKSLNTVQVNERVTGESESN